MSKQMTVMFNPLNMVGPMNAAIGMAEVLKNSGHRIVFAVKSDWSGKLKIHGFEEEIIGHNSQFDNKGSQERNATEFSALFGPESRLEKMITLNKSTVDSVAKDIEESEPFLGEIVKRVKPDVILIDNIFWIPSIMGSGIPWVLVMTCNPLAFEYAMVEERLPPSGLGLPTNSDPQEWKRIRDQLNDSLNESWTKFNNWIVSKGQPPLPQNKLLVPSPYLNVYIFPKELDYTDIRPYPQKFYRFDCFKRTGNEEIFELPEKLRNKRGKLIYLSLGSMGSGNVELMKRLVGLLSNSKHRFIVSKGAFGDQYQLPDNMWGENYVPQIKILPIIDLLITHGGNNTLTETLYYGKPILVMPLFFDQFDNAQRIVEKGLSIRLDPFQCSETELIEAIDKLLNDNILKEKLTKISQRIQREQNILKLPQIIQSLVK